jgi:hypothetical protein
MSGGMRGGGICEPAQNSMNGLGSSIGVEGEFTIDRRDQPQACVGLIKPSRRRAWHNVPENRSAFFGQRTEDEGRMLTVLRPSSFVKHSITLLAMVCWY